ncbi:MAG: hypothetical protein KC708_02315 [Anaerolineae bacterium]|nr:hypothetical protein [Anaerolineae bacterium]
MLKNNMLTIHHSARIWLGLLAILLLIGSNVLAQGTPEEVFDQFMAAWNEHNFEAMYALVHPQAQEMYPKAVFETRYEGAELAMGFGSVATTLTETRIQGISAELHYDATITSTTFGDIPDPDRTMRMMQVDGTWRIAWSPMDILRDLASEVVLRSSNDFLPRANIYDTNGQSLVQQGGRIIQLFAIKGEILNQQQCYSTLAEMMLRSYGEIEQIFLQYDDETYFQLGETDPETYARYTQALSESCNISENNTFGGDRIAEFTDRNYYGHGAAAHVTGFVGAIPQEELASWQARGYGSGDSVGRFGIERTQESYLAGLPASRLQMVAPGEIVIRDLGSTTSSPPTPVQLTIDRDLQYVVAKAINDAYNYAGERNWGQSSISQGAAAVVMDIHTGAVLAMASYPTFDPRIYNLSNTGYGSVALNYLLERAFSDAREPLINKAISQYTPGSVYKIFTTAAAAQEGVFPFGPNVTEDQRFQCDLIWNGAQYGDTAGDRPDWRVADEIAAAGPVYMWQALSTSCNPFFWEMGGRLYQQRGANVNLSYAQRFGLGSPTGIVGLENENSGNLAAPNNPSAAINNAIGQGDVQVTPLQMVTAVAAVANNGTVWQPYIIQQIGGFDGTDVVSVTEPTVVNELQLDQAVLDEIRRGMCNVPVDEDLGTSYRTFGPNSNPPPSYTSCGKTGTAQAGAPGTTIPPHSWYVSYAPADNPQIATVVLVRYSREGSEVAAPITRRILDYYFNAPTWPYPEWWNNRDYVQVAVPSGFSGTER